MKLALMLLLAVLVCDSPSCGRPSQNTPDPQLSMAEWIAALNNRKEKCSAYSVDGGWSDSYYSWSMNCVNGVEVYTDTSKELQAWRERENERRASVRTYYPVSISDLAAGRNSHTHIRATGKVVLVKHEADGDLHIRLSDGKHFIVAECIPEFPCAEPKVGQRITVEGISRFDKKHGWSECHPVLNLKGETR